MIQYRTELTNRPPIPANVQRAQMAEMKSYAPTGGQDMYRSALNLAGYQKQTDMANLQYSAAQRAAERQMALAGLTNLYQQQAADQSLAGSLLGRLMG